MRVLKAPALPVRGFSGTPEEIERQWYEQVSGVTIVIWEHAPELLRRLGSP